MTERQGLTILFMLGTMFAQIEHHETTRSINKIRKQIRLGIGKYHKKVGEEKYMQTVEYANTVWEAAKKDVNPNEFTVSLAWAMSIAYGLLDKPYKSLWFSELNFDKALRSLEYGFVLTPEVKDSSEWLIGVFEDMLEIEKQPSRFAQIVKGLR